MNVFEAIEKRRSVRRYARRPIEHEKIERILHAGRLAPSSNNQQAWHFIVVDDPDLLKALPKQVPVGTARIIDFAQHAACVIVGCYTRRLTHVAAALFGQRHELIDVTIALAHMVLAATEMGIGTCYLGWFSEKKIRRLLGIPAAYRVACLVACGYPESATTDTAIGGVAPHPRKDLREIASRNHWNTAWF